MSAVQDWALQMFFPNGKSQQGKIQDFDHRLILFDETDLLDEETIRSFYARTNVKILRLYLCSMKKSHQTSSQSGGKSKEEDVIRENETVRKNLKFDESPSHVQKAMVNTKEESQLRGEHKENPVNLEKETVTKKLKFKASPSHV